MIRSLDPEIERAISNIDRRKKEIRRETGYTELDEAPVATVGSNEPSTDLLDHLNEAYPAWREEYSTPEEAAAVLLSSEVQFDLFDAEPRAPKPPWAKGPLGRTDGH